MTAVFLQYDQAALDSQYDQATLVPDLGPYKKHWAEAGEAARMRLGPLVDVPYGPSPVETLDIYRPPEATAAPVHIYFHGGAWRGLDKADGAFVAPAVVGAGAVFVSAGFGLIPAVRLAEQVRQARAAVAWAYRSIAGYGGDPERITVSGHSSGGHLVGCLVAAGWHEAFGVPEDVVKAAVSASGLFDLEPVRLSARNAYLDLDAEDVDLLSPIRHIPRGGAPHLAVTWADGDLAEFRRQSRAFAEAWTAAGHPVDAEELPGRNHFDVSDAFGDPAGPIVRRILAGLHATTAP